MRGAWEGQAGERVRSIATGGGTGVCPQRGVNRNVGRSWEGHSRCTRSLNRELLGVI